MVRDERLRDVLRISSQCSKPFTCLGANTSGNLVGAGIACGSQHWPATSASAPVGQACRSGSRPFLRRPQRKNACADEQAELAIAMVKTWTYKCVETGPGYALEFTGTLVGSCRRELNRADSMALMQAVPRHPARLGVLRLRAPPRLHVSSCSSCYHSHRRRCSSSCLTQKKLLTQKKRNQKELTNKEADTKEAVLATGHAS